MTKYLAPLGVFVMGQISLLILFLFMPHLQTNLTALASETAAIGGSFWLWTWVVGSGRLLVYIIFELIVLLLTAKAFLRVK